MTKTITIYGASDDLIEIDGDLREEFNYYSTNWEQNGFLAISDGTLLRVRYDEDGIWRFTPIVIGSAQIDIKQGVDDREHSDRVTLRGEHLTWVALADEARRIKE
jgi:hypothetical protein